MAKPKLERNGDGDGQEMDQESTVTSETTQTPVVYDSPTPATESPTKWVVFRSHDKELALFQKAGFMDKSHGMVTYNPSVGVQFVDFYLRVQDIPKHADTIKWLRGHPSNGISFAEVPDLSNIVELPTIAQLKQMSIVELKELCAKNKVKVVDDASMDTIILALIENVK
jgi:hypothetical protein